jgi:small subunit ribosomal protein S5
MEDLMGSVGGGRRGGRGMKKKKVKKQDTSEISFGHGKDFIEWPWKTSTKYLYGANWLRDSNRGGISKPTQGDRDDQQTSFTLDQIEGQQKRVFPLSHMYWSTKGWTGKSLKGRYIGCPEAPNGEPLTEFYSVMVDLKRVSNQTPTGRKKTISATVLVGNGNGLVGFGVGRGEVPMAAIRKAKNKAVNYLQFIPRYNDHTLFHNINVKYKQTKIQMERRCPGTGLSCHRIITSIFQLAGVKDARAKIIGNSKNPLNVVRATFKGVTSQQVYQTVSDDSERFLVENRRECYNRPVIMALPKSTDTEEMRDYLQKKQMLPS